MHLFRLSTVLLFAALATACASAPPAQTSNASAPATVIDGSADANANAVASSDSASSDSMPSQTAPIVADGQTASNAGAAPTTAEDDFAAIYGGASDAVADPTLPAAAVSPQAYDPWEKFNRKVHTFNNAVDRAVARPLARAYTNVVPRPVRLGVSNFFDNLGQPITAINQLLQGRPKEAGQTVARFLVNSTLGIGGIFDPASDLKLPRRSEDFGQTLGVWGWKKSRYVELPLFGPRTVRDTLGMSGDMPIGVVRQIEMDKVRIFLQGLNLVDTRAQLLSVDSLREGAVDDYALVRDSWMQRRAYQIEGSRKQDEDKDLPDYLNDEDPDPTVPVDAMPMPELVPGG